MSDAAPFAAHHAASHGSFIVRFGEGGFQSWANALYRVPPDDPVDDSCAPTGTRAEDAAFAEGFSAGHAAAVADQAEARAHLATLTTALEALQPVPQPALASLIAESVSTILERFCASVTADPAVLATMAQDMIAALADEIEPLALHANPQDAALLFALDLPVALNPDDMLAPGTLRLATRAGWVEDGVELRLARFRAAIAWGNV
jgi:flagellar assembly protein FliH